MEEQQIKICIDEMEKLKGKMEALEKQKILNEKNEMLKKTTIEPNLKVLENWLVDYHKAIEDNKKRQKGQQHNYQKHSYDIIHTVRNSNTGIRTGDYYNEPSVFMQAHIEATYNMFNIINKRLDDIEKKLGINN